MPEHSTRYVGGCMPCTGCGSFLYRYASYVLCSLSISWVGTGWDSLVSSANLLTFELGLISSSMSFM